jgi:hypothetical protein
MRKAFDNPSCIRERLSCVIVVSILAVTCACATKWTKGKRLTEAEVITIADRVAVKNGYSLNKFVKFARYNLVEKDNTWMVFYRPKPGAPGTATVGADFTVSVKAHSRPLAVYPNSELSLRHCRKIC